MSEPSTTSRSYDNTARRQKAAETADRIVAAGADLVHEFASWDWGELTFRAVAQRAGVGERTVFRHFPTERHLHDAVMARLERDAGISYEDVTLASLPEVTGRVFGSLQRFAVAPSVAESRDPTFTRVDERRRAALLAAVGDAAPHWSELQIRSAAGLLDVLWNLPTYERLTGAWALPEQTATAIITWLMDKVVDAIDGGEPPSV